MLEFSRLGKDVVFLNDYIKQSTISFCDISVGIRYMWGDEFVVDYCIFNDTLIMKESSPDYKNAFYYPMGKDVEGALCEIENYCVKNNLPLTFCCLDNLTASQLANRYHKVSIKNDRDWSDYIYDAEKFRTYSGKKFSGQRNHVNKFKKLYPNYNFKVIEQSDFVRIKEFLDEFENKTEFLRWTEAIEQKKVYDFVLNMFNLNQVGGLLEVDGKVVAFSVGEVVNKTLIVHVEKALRKYEGVYPTMAQEFAKAFAVGGVKLINREEDCGDIGLRISKLQYQPIEVKEKNFLTAHTLFDKISTPVLIQTERLTITQIFESDKEDYCRLYLDDQLNKLWGYDYKEDLNGEEPTPDYFFAFQNSLKEKKEEFSFAVKLCGKMIGELVLHNFDFFGGVEMGFRFFKQFHGKGFAIESATALKNYVIDTLGAKKLKSRCFKENIPSANLINRLGLTKSHEDQTHYYFELKL
ncbi:MAG: GNAT family N-acetyltransferase [Clostridiales bacterium]|nr:GNAT family N-acetyltransferase [Clostridiales bacterium]